ncbi:hypothetical protein [Actinomadura sp. WMMA1423]|uniref:TY-Chap domain-containing protein n=1 Tax=Actinomadura sp. WMMA1423 TaxID=2591108 RepID=UPI001146432A|nr:hypothetical protein [Actinomadura sp. WMMA1423]
MTWDEFGAALADTLARLPDGTLLTLHEVRQPIGGDYAQIWQDSDGLYLFAELAGNRDRAADRQLSRAQQDQLRAAGWWPLEDDPDESWRGETFWPATTAETRYLAERIVAGFRDVFRLGSPTELAYQASVDTGHRVEPLPLPELGLETIRIQYFARLGPADRPDRPKGLLRRIRSGSVTIDEALHRDGHWRPTDTLEWADIGEIDDELVPVRPVEADQVVRWWRKLAAQAAEDAKLPPGTPRMRMAAAVDQERDASGRAVPPTTRIHDRERPALVAYLRGAPMIAAAWGYDPDPFDPDRAGVVPLNFRTDGVWVWSESLAYFAERYGIPPEPDFLRHMAQRSYRLSDVDQETLDRAVAFLRHA